MLPETLLDKNAPRFTVSCVPNTPQLHVVGERPHLGQYLASAWAFRHLGLQLAKLRLKSEGGGTLLGPLWLLVTPLLNALLFYVVFAGFLKVNDQVENYPLFLLTGVLLYAFFRQGVTAAAGALRAENDLVRSMPFPRLIPPLAALAVELGKLGWSLVILIPLAAFATGVHLSWCAAAAGLVLLSLWTAGLGLILARLSARIPDLSKALPVALRGLAFLSGVYFPLSVANVPNPWSTLLELNPVASSLIIVREGLMGVPVDGTGLALLAGISLSTFLGGLFLVWRGEPRYGS